MVTKTKSNIKPFNKVLNEKRLNKKFEVAKLKENQYLAISKEHIGVLPEFSEGSKSPTDQMPFLIARSSYYWAYLLRNLYARKAVKKSESVVLDLGCASGFMGQMIHRGTYLARTRYIGIDAQTHSLNEAITNLGGSRFFLIQDHLNGKLPYIKDNSVDTVYAMEIIEHMTKHEAKILIKDIYRMMKPGGRFILSTPNADAIQHGEKHRDFHLYEYHLDEMQKMLNKYFEIDRVLGWSDQDSTSGRIEQYLSDQQKAFVKNMSTYVSGALIRQMIIGMFPEHATAVIYDGVRR